MFHDPQKVPSFRQIVDCARQLIRILRRKYGLLKVDACLVLVEFLVQGVYDRVERLCRGQDYTLRRVCENPFANFHTATVVEGNID